MRIQLSVNGEKHEADVEPRLLLVHLLRENLRLTGTHIGCDTTPLRRLHGPPGRPRGEVVHGVRRAGQRPRAHDRRGLEQNGKLHPLQEGFMAEHGLQCGYCTPGMLMTSYAFLKKHPSPARTTSAGPSPAISAAAPAT